MGQDDLVRLEKVLRFACRLFSRPYDDALLACYAVVLDGANIGAIESAAAAHFRSSRFFPEPCDLLGSATSIESERLVALEAWHALLRRQDKVPRREIATEALRLVGGPMMLRDLTVDQTPHRRREFVEVFLLLAAQARRAEPVERPLLPSDFRDVLAEVAP